MRSSSRDSTPCVLGCGYGSDLAKSKTSDDYGYSADSLRVSAGNSVCLFSHPIHLAFARCRLNAAPRNPTQMNGDTSFSKGFSKMQIVILLSWLIVIAAPIELVGACLQDDYSVKAEYARSEAVVTARVVSKREIPDPEDSSFIGRTFYTVKIEGAYRGKLHGFQDIVSENNSGRFPLKDQKSYILFLYRQEGVLSADPCGNSGLVSDRMNVFAEVRALSEKDRTTHRALKPPRRSF